MNESVIIPNNRIKEFNCKDCGCIIRYVAQYTETVICPKCHRLYKIDEVTVIHW